MKSSVIPKAFAGLLKVDKPKLLRAGLPYVYHKAYTYSFNFKTIHDSNSGDSVTAVTAMGQHSTYDKIISTTITKPFILGIGSFPTDKGCNALASKILYEIDNNNKDFSFIVVSALIHSPKKIESLYEKIPEIVCILDLFEESSVCIENARAIMSVYTNSVIIVPVATNNILNFFKYRLHKTGIYLQFSNLYKTKEL